MNIKEWTDTLKPGDLVLVDGFNEHIEKVVRLTPTQVVVGVNRFRRSDGRVIGGGGRSYDFIKPLTESDKARIAAAIRYRTAVGTFESLANEVRKGFNWRVGEGRYTVEQLKAAIDILRNRATTYEPQPQEKPVPEVPPV